MAEKHIVVQGAICKCQYGQAPDTLKVLSHDKEYANDKDASKKRIATTKEIGEKHFWQLYENRRKSPAAL